MRYVARLGRRRPEPAQRSSGAVSIRGPGKREGIPFCRKVVAWTTCSGLRFLFQPAFLPSSARPTGCDRVVPHHPAWAWRLFARAGLIFAHCTFCFHFARLLRHPSTVYGMRRRAAQQRASDKLNQKQSLPDLHPRGAGDEQSDARSVTGVCSPGRHPSLVYHGVPRFSSVWGTKRLFEAVLGREALARPLRRGNVPVVPRRPGGQCAAVSAEALAHRCSHCLRDGADRGTLRVRTARNPAACKPTARH